MGVSYTSYAAIGVRVDPKQLKREKMVRSCHCMIDGEPAYCPRCGRKFRVSDSEWVDGCEPVGCTPETFMGFPLAFSTDDKSVVICTALAKTKYGSECEMVQVDDAMESGATRLRDVLAPLGMWDRSQFGLWAVQKCSY